MAESSRGRRLSDQAKRLIIQLSRENLTTCRIQKTLQSKLSIQITRQGIHAFLKRFSATGSFSRIRSVRRPSKLGPLHRQFINLWLSQNNEMTAYQISKKLFETFGLKVSTRLVCQTRKALGWKTCVAKYCQLISNKNKKVRLEWCLKAVQEKEDFENVVFVDETTVEMNSNGRIFFHKNQSKFENLPSKRQKPKHSYKVHVWAGISYKGRSDICIFTGVMDSVIYQKILEKNFLPWAIERFGEGGYRLYQDNDSKHKSKSTRDWMVKNGLLQPVMDTPASSPDLNPIENVWSSLKHYLQNHIKPRKRDELLQGIVDFWKTLSAEQCAKYIDHIHRVIPVVILNNGGPSGF